MTALLLTGGVTYGPDLLGASDILMVGREVAAVSPHGETAQSSVASVLADVSVIDCANHLVVPGLVDGHLHIVGGGGGQGFSSRIPDLPADAILEAGITTCVGMPGVDTISKPPGALLARAAALTQSGIRAYAMAGGFRWPSPTITGELFSDLYFLPQLLGVKIAVDEHLATAPSTDQLVRLLTELEWLAGATGKGALLHVHLGTRRSSSQQILGALSDSGASPERVQATHANYSEETLATATELGLHGCFVDVNPLLNPDRVAGSVRPVDAVRHLLAAGVPAHRITLSTDGNASVPRTLPDGERERFSHQLGLLSAIRDLVRADVVDAASAIGFATRNPARALRLDPIGTLAAGAPADALVIDEDFTVRDVIAAGRVVVKDGRATSASPFRDPRWRS